MQYMKYKCEYCKDTKMGFDYFHNQDLVFEPFPCPNCDKDEYEIWKKESNATSN
mgnify:CR=1 FL=1